MKIAVGMMWQESASFSQLATGRRAFEALAWRAGTALLEKVPDGSELRGLLDICADRDDVELVGTRGGSAWPSGPVEREVYEELRDGIVEGVRHAMPLNGVFIVLHGSMVTGGAPTSATTSKRGPSSVMRFSTRAPTTSARGVPLTVAMGFCMPLSPSSLPYHTQQVMRNLGLLNCPSAHLFYATYLGSAGEGPARPEHDIKRFVIKPFL